MNLILEECNDESRRDEIAALVATNSLSTIIRSWVNLEQDIVIMTGSDGVTNKSRVYVLFEFATAELATAYYESEALLKKFPIINDFIPPPFAYTVEEYEEQKLSKEEKRFYKKQDRLMAVVWNKDLYGYVSALDPAINAALGLSLSEHGETTFSLMSKTSCEEIENGEIYAEHFLSVDFTRADKDRAFGTHQTHYVDLERDTDLKYTNRLQRNQSEAYNQNIIF